MGRFDWLKNAVSSAINWVKQFYGRVGKSAVHVEAIQEDFEWFEAKLDELEPEARLRIESVIFSFKELGKIWGFE